MARRNTYRTLWLLLWVVAIATSAPVLGWSQIYVEGALTQRIELEPGASHSGFLTVRNAGDQPEDVRLVQYDYRRTQEGERFYTDPGSIDRSNNEWISISPRRFTIPPGENHTISYVVTVPLDESLTGTYWSVLMIEPVPAESPESPEFDPSETSVGITTLIRYAVVFITSIGDTGTIEPQIIGASLREEEGARIFAVDVDNTGTRVLDITAWIELFDEDGASIGRWEGTEGTVLPLSSRRYPVTLTDVPHGSFTALVVLDCGDNNVFGVSLPLTIE